MQRSYLHSSDWIGKVSIILVKIQLQELLCKAGSDSRIVKVGNSVQVSPSSVVSVSEKPLLVYTFKLDPSQPPGALLGWHFLSQDGSFFRNNSIQCVVNLNWHAVQFSSMVQQFYCISLTIYYF